MPEVVLVVFVIGLVFSPQILAYKFAEYLGRDKKFWFWISFLIPVISLFVLMFLPETEKPES